MSMSWSKAIPALILVMVLTGCATMSEPILLDAPDLDPRYRDYLGRVSQMIREKWSYPRVKDEATGKCEYKPAQLVIDFALFEDGRVRDVTVTKSSGMDVYDERAVKAVKAASPFPRVPPELMARAKPGSTGVTIRAVVTYKRVTQP
jgi:TonB family protein